MEVRVKKEIRDGKTHQMAIIILTEDNKESKEVKMMVQEHFML